MSIRIRRRIKAALRVRNPILRACFAEFLGTLILIVFGDGSVAQAVLSGGTAGTFLTINFAWGLAVAMAVWASGGVSGGHVNPAVTLTFCLMGRLPWRMLIPYWLGQYMGAFVGSACIYGVYVDALDAFDGGIRQVVGPNGTAGIWATYPKPFLTSNIGLADQVLATALLLCMVLAITDKNNMKPSTGMVPLCVGLVVAVIGMSFGFNCGYAINPARDWGPRIFTAVAGWGSGVFTFRDLNWFWVPFVGPHIGAIVGAMVYQILVGIHFPDEGEEVKEVEMEKIPLEKEKKKKPNGNVNEKEWFGSNFEDQKSELL